SPFGKIEIDGRKIGFTHEEKFAKEQEGFDVIFYGHWHKYKTKMVNGTLFVCCGELEERKINACYVIYDTNTNEVEKVGV
ncbi:MAG: metallophosphoesterase family protein, partial [Planctomycetota bacterium]